MCFDTTKHVFCRDKIMFVATKLLSRQAYFCLDKGGVTCGSPPPMTVVGLHNNYTYGDSWWKQYNALAWHARKHETCPSRVRETDRQTETETDRDTEREFRLALDDFGFICAGVTNVGGYKKRRKKKKKRKQNKQRLI